MITYKDSVALAHRLKKMSPAILGIELFGSVVRKGYGRDTDFLILVDNELAKRWWLTERELIRVRWPDSLHGLLWIVKKFIPFVYAKTVRDRRRKRLKASTDMLGIELESLINSSGELPDFEMFFVPTKWRTGTEVNIDLMRQMTDLVDHRNTLGFLNRIAREAVKL